MIQQDLWPPTARRTDPATSHDAAEHMDKTGKRRRQQQIVYRAVYNFPLRTSFELTEHCELDRYQIARRLADLEDRGMVRKCAARPCRITGRLAVTWAIVTKHPK